MSFDPTDRDILQWAAQTVCGVTQLERDMARTNLLVAFAQQRASIALLRNELETRRARLSLVPNQQEGKC